MFYLYIDESGDTGDYKRPDGSIIIGSSKYFTLAGIIVSEQSRIEFEKEFDQLINETFEDVTLPQNFKLHYHPLRNKRPPYDQISDEKRWNIPNSIFKWIENGDCDLLSVTIDLDKHCEYERPADPRAYALLLLLERFQYFLEDQTDIGIAIYEKFNAKMRKDVERDQRWLQKISTFPVPIKLDLLAGNVINGNPSKEPLLQIADFIAYAPWIKKMSEEKATKRFSQIVLKYYNLGDVKSRSGFVEL